MTNKDELSHISLLIPVFQSCSYNNIYNVFQSFSYKYLLDQPHFLLSSIDSIIATYNKQIPSLARSNLWKVETK